MRDPEPHVSDELYANLCKQGEELVNSGLIVMNVIQFRVALLNAYKRGYTDGWHGKKT